MVRIHFLYLYYDSIEYNIVYYNHGTGITVLIEKLTVSLLLYNIVKLSTFAVYKQLKSFFDPALHQDCRIPHCTSGADSHPIYMSSLIVCHRKKSINVKFCHFSDHSVAPLLPVSVQRSLEKQNEQDLQNDQVLLAPHTDTPGWFRLVSGIMWGLETFQ
jgi:hypothetical protein